MNADSLPEGVRRVAAALQALGHPQTPVMLSDSARTAQQAADALGVALGQIAKSIVFRLKPDDRAVLVVTSGDLRVDEHKVQALVCGPGQKLGRADADLQAVADLVAKHGLQDIPVDKLASWWHSDADLGRTLECFTDMTNSRTLGFDAYQSTRSSFTDVFDELRARRIIPS